MYYILFTDQCNYFELFGIIVFFLLSPNFRNILSNTSYPEAGYEFGQFLKSTDGIFGKYHFLRLTAFRNWISIPDIINEEKKVMVW